MIMKTWQEEPEIYSIFKSLCASKDQSMGEVLNKLIKRYVKENEIKEE